MNACDKVNKVMSIPMLAMSAVAGVIDFQNGAVCLGISMVICSAWWIYVIYKLFISKKQ